MRGENSSRALSNVIATMVLVVIIVILLVPLLIYANYLSSYTTVSREVTNNYVYLKNLQVTQVTTGHPGFYYNGSTIYVVYSNGTFVPSSNVTITSILYLDNNGVWRNITTLKYPITLSSNQVLTLPSYASNSPVIIVTSLGNIFFLTPNASIGPVSFSSKGGVVIVAQIYTQNGPISVYTNVTTNIMGKMQNYTTPVAFPNTTGTFVAKVPQYVYYQNSKGQIVTGVFKNWAVIGKAMLNSTTSPGIQVTLQGSPVVLIANYTPLNAYVTVTLKTNYPGTVQVIVDGNTYSFTGTKTIQVPAGYANITVLTLQGNDTSLSSQGIIKHYSFSNITVQVGTTTYTYKTYTVLTFFPVNSQPVVSINYVNDYNYYQVNFVGVRYIIYNATYVWWIFSYTKQYNYVGQITLGTKLYNYSTSKLIKGGNYPISFIGYVIPTYYNGLKITQINTNNGTIYVNPPSSASALSYLVKQVVFQYSNGTSFTYNFPNLPAYVVINQPMTIKVYYNVTMFWKSL